VPHNFSQQSRNLPRRPFRQYGHVGKDATLEQQLQHVCAIDRRLRTNSATHLGYPRGPAFAYLLEVYAVTALSAFFVLLRYALAWRTYVLLVHSYLDKRAIKNVLLSNNIQELLIHAHRSCF
jgi:hypothetical protein